MEFEFSECINGKREKIYKWREPKICDEGDTHSFKLL
jgi:hypothetical protein